MFFEVATPPVFNHDSWVHGDGLLCLTRLLRVDCCITCRLLWTLECALHMRTNVTVTCRTQAASTALSVPCKADINISCLNATIETTMNTSQCQIKDFDFVQFTFADIHGISRGKSIPKRHVSRFMEEGIDLYAGKLSGSRALARPVVSNLGIWSCLCTYGRACLSGNYIGLTGQRSICRLAMKWIMYCLPNISDVRFTGNDGQCAGDGIVREDGQFTHVQKWCKKDECSVRTSKLFHHPLRHAKHTVTPEWVSDSTRCSRAAPLFFVLQVLLSAKLCRTRCFRVSRTSVNIVI